MTWTEEQSYTRPQSRKVTIMFLKLNTRHDIVCWYIYYTYVCAYVLGAQLSLWPVECIMILQSAKLSLTEPDSCI